MDSDNSPPTRKGWLTTSALGGAFTEGQALLMLGLLAWIKGTDRAVITHHSGPDFTALALLLR